MERQIQWGMIGIVAAFLVVMLFLEWRRQRRASVRKTRRSRDFRQMKSNAQRIRERGDGRRPPNRFGG